MRRFRLSWLDDARKDLAFATRLARHHPGFSTNVVLITALGIAACVSTFSLISGILLAPLNFPAQDRVFSFYLKSAEGDDWAALPTSVYRAIEHSPTFAGVTASEPDRATVDLGGDPRQVKTGRVTPSFFRVFRTRPFLGRTFDDPEVASSAPVVVLGYEEWRTHFGGDSALIGRTIQLDGSPHTVIGVTAQGFLGNFEGDRFIPSMWVPLRVEPGDEVNLTLRLADGMSKQRAEAYLATLARFRVPAGATRDSIDAAPELVPVSERVYGDARGPLLVLLGAVLLVLLLVGANVATMFLARASVRRAEFGVRTALGASGGRLLRQVVAESLALTAAGGVIGIAASYLVVDLVRSLGKGLLPRIDNVAIDSRVMFFAATAIVVTGCAGGVAHFLSARRLTDLAAGARVTSARASGMLVVAQVALSLVLLVGAGLLLKGFARVAPTAPGFELHNRASLDVMLRDQPGFAAGSVEDRRRLIARVMDRLQRIDNVQAVTATSFVPLTGMVWGTEIDIPDMPPASSRRPAFRNTIAPNYFDVMRVPLLSGRAFAATDREGAERVAIVNETAAQRWFPGESPLGRRLSVGKGDDRELVTVVGVVRGSRMHGRTTRMYAEIYLPLAQSDIGYTSFVVATTADPRGVMPRLREALRGAAPQLPIIATTDFESIAAESVRIERFYASAMTFFAGAAIALSALAVYGLLAFAVAQRRREIGIRMAIGATPGRIGALVLRKALTIGGAGVVVGMLLARGLSRYLESVLTEVTPTDAPVFISAALAGIVVAALAACVPVYQAVTVNPAETIRT